MLRFKFQLVLSFFFLSFFTFSQSNTLVVFSQDPTPFYVILDGVKKNETAETRVIVPGIQQTNSSVQIFFKDESIASISKTIWWEEGHKNDEVTFRIVPVKKGYKLRFFSTKLNTSTPVASTPPHLRYKVFNQPLQQLLPKRLRSVKTTRRAVMI